MESFIESMLSLSQNGGIPGGKATTDRTTAVLLVGLGGAGADALLQIKNQINRKVYDPNVEYLEIDTDESVAKATYNTTSFSETEEEFCDISVDSIQSMLNRVKEAKSLFGEECWKWVDERIQVYGEYGRTGACRIRQIGRMQLFMNINKVMDSVSAKIDRLLQKEPERLVISVCSGISGGTGSGILLDMAYILRKVAQAKIPNTITMGYVVMPDVDEMRIDGSKTHRTALRANGYACLKELDYYTRIEELWNSTKREPRYKQIFPNGFKVDVVDRPFEYLHLINAKDINGNVLSYTKIWESVAKNIMMYVIGQYDIEAYEPNILRLYELKTYRWYPRKGYFSLGTSEIKMPCTEIRALFISRIFENLEISVFENRPTENQFNISVFKDLELSEECIRSVLYKSVTVQRPFLEGKIYKYADVWTNNAPYQTVYYWLGMFQKSVASQAANLPVYLEEKFKEFIKRNLKDRKTGPFYLRYYVKSQTPYCLAHMLESFRRCYFELQQQCTCKSKELKNDMQQAFVEGSNAGLFNRKKALKNYLKALDAWYRNEEHAFLYEKMAEVLETIQFRINLYYEKILQPLTNTLNRMSEICAENVQYLQSVSEKSWIIQPLEFEKFQEKKFHELAEKAANDFTEYLYENLRKWIGRDIDNVDEDSKTDIDIEESLRNFIYDSRLYNELGYEDIERNIYTTKLYKEMSPEDYMVNLFQDLLKEAPLMYRDNFQNHDYDREFVMLYVPANEQILYRTAIEFRRKINEIWFARSRMSDRISIIRGRAISSLSSNAFLPDMKRAYEEIKTTGNSGGIDLRSECRDILFEDDIANSIDEEQR